MILDLFKLVEMKTKKKQNVVEVNSPMSSLRLFFMSMMEKKEPQNFDHIH